ncbi:MAG: hypothetical protein UT48_C0017G0024 [Parcubacteria group bacterium GW2011_GWE2_39_37]|uniref:DUF4342 domain-containing protein n=1 Tax=Candidatus Falkowbacteria bacterium GW2011_GWF2_39_8 TaxID=1618642 RepID=A0A0G0SFB3_9BACT|nr:MAG: hypothetical protein UT48_C0017G0024 [Parcubacteria group bacterium GW2011_GWE2_39_37]KKR33395.1 MAG: hypothetical protein UT64_C0009G0007 [Candidatus Falkowbacteria bacterium GW2011_GWF2_39_8]
MANAKNKQKQEKCENCSEEFSKEFKLSGEKLVKKVKELIKEGNARKIIIKNEKGKAIMEIPVTVGAVGVVLAPVLAAVGALAALVTECTIEVVKKK